MRLYAQKRDQMNLTEQSGHQYRSTLAKKDPMGSQACMVIVAASNATRRTCRLLHGGVDALALLW